MRAGLIIFLAVTTAAQTPVETEARLPVQRVVLYKNGIGYFEHMGRVQGNQDVPIQFTSGQLDDVLKSLTALDLDGGRITGVTYGSRDTVDRQLGNLRLGVGEKATLVDFLGALRGAKVEIRNGTSVITGRLLSVERKTRVSGGTTLEVDYVSVLTDTGELRTAELSPAFSVRLLERSLAGKVGQFLDLAALSRETDARRMVVSTTGTGARRLFVSYLSEVPVWKTTYRIVMNPAPGQSPLLQGWAIVDNVTGQDWENVQLSLVAGAPQSFIQKLSQPFYSRRAVVPLPGNLAISPQTHEATLIAGSGRLTGTVRDPGGALVAYARVKLFGGDGLLIAETESSGAGVYEFKGLSDGAVRLQVELPGFQTASLDLVASSTETQRRDVVLQIGSVSEAVTVTAATPPLNTATAEVRRGGHSQSKQFIPPAAPIRSAEFSAALQNSRIESHAQALGELFEYKLDKAVTIRKGQSALAPIAHTPVTVEKVSLWNEGGGLPRPRRALWLTNSSNLTLDSGSFTVLEEQTFAGEGLLDAIRPGEKRLLSYAVDLALNVSSQQGSEQQRVSRVRINRGTMIHESEMRNKKTYTFRNEDSNPRTVIVEHPVRSGHQLRSSPEPIEISAGYMRFRVQVEPKKTTTLLVEESLPVSTTYSLSDIDADRIAIFLSQKSISAPIENALRRIVQQKTVLDQLEDEHQTQDGEIKRIFEDQGRLRENMKALKGSAGELSLLQRYTQQLNEQETRLAALRNELKETERRQIAAQAELDRMIDEVSFDVKL